MPVVQKLNRNNLSKRCRHRLKPPPNKPKQPAVKRGPYQAQLDTFGRKVYLCNQFHKEKSVWVEKSSAKGAKGSALRLFWAENEEKKQPEGKCIP